MESKAENIKSRIVTGLACIIAVSFVINIFYYGPSEGFWFTFGLYDQLFFKVIDTIFTFFDFVIA